MRRLLSRFLLVIGMQTAVFISCIAASPEDSGFIKFMTYNVHHCNPPSKPGVIDVDAIAKVIKQENPDIIALQEIDVNTRRSGKINEAALLAQKSGYHSFHFSKTIDFDGGQYGIMLLSRYSLSDMETHKLPTDPATGGEPRVLSVATATLPNGRQIRVVSVHLDFHGKTNSKLQMTEVNKILSSQKLPVIIGGDFNAVESSETIGLLDKEFTRTCKNCAFTIEEGKEKMAIDFIAYKPGAAFSIIKHQVIEEDDASDHRPVLARLKIRF